MKTDHQIHTERLLLRSWNLSEADRQAFHRLNSDPQVMHFFPHRKTRQESDDLLPKLLTMNSEQGYGWAAICLRDDQAPIGFAGIAPVNYFKAAFVPGDEIGWRLLPEFWGQGYASEAARALLTHAFNDLDFNRIVSFAVSSNHASINVMKRIGMIAEPHYDFDHPNVPDTHVHLKRHVVYAAHRA